eukprot:gene32201-31659_t
MFVEEEECFDGSLTGRLIPNHAPVSTDFSFTAKIQIASGGGYIFAKGAVDGKLMYALQVHPTQERLYFHYQQLQASGKTVLQRIGWNTPGLKDGKVHRIVLAVSKAKGNVAMQVDNARQLEFYSADLVDCTEPSTTCSFYIGQSPPVYFANEAETVFNGCIAEAVVVGVVVCEVVPEDVNDDVGVEVSEVVVVGVVVCD